MYVRSFLHVAVKPVTLNSPFRKNKVKSKSKTVPRHTIPRHTVPYHTIPRHSIPYHTIHIPVFTQNYLSSLNQLLQVKVDWRLGWFRICSDPHLYHIVWLASQVTIPTFREARRSEYYSPSTCDTRSVPVLSWSSAWYLLPPLCHSVSLSHFHC